MCTFIYYTIAMSWHVRDQSLLLFLSKVRAYYITCLLKKKLTVRRNAKHIHFYFISFYSIIWISHHTTWMNKCWTSEPLTYFYFYYFCFCLKKNFKKRKEKNTFIRKIERDTHSESDADSRFCYSLAVDVCRYDGVFVLGLGIFESCWCL